MKSLLTLLACVLSLTVARGVEPPPKTGEPRILKWKDGKRAGLSVSAKVPSDWKRCQIVRGAGQTTVPAHEGCRAAGKSSSSGQGTDA